MISYGAVGRVVEDCTFSDTEMLVDSVVVSVYCVTEHAGLSALLQSTQLNDEYQVDALFLGLFAWSSDIKWLKKLQPNKCAYMF